MNWINYLRLVSVAALMIVGLVGCAGSSDPPALGTPAPSITAPGAGTAAPSQATPRVYPGPTMSPQPYPRPTAAKPVPTPYPAK